MTNINFRPIFPSPLGYVNFGEDNRDLNKRLIEDIETEMSESEGKTKTFIRSTCNWSTCISSFMFYSFPCISYWSSWTF